MCGIAGIVWSGAVDDELLRGMAARLAHRGPDDAGVWIDPQARIGLGHRRLSIVDLSPAGHQPMTSRDGRWVLTFNGEIYNHAAIRAELEAGGRDSNWRGHSDTETLLEAIALWGLEPAIGRCAGMFALALWDKAERRLHLVRDRFGEKPLYYGRVGRDFVFASELKAIRALPGFSNPISREALAILARRGYVPAPLSIYEGIHKLEPGCILSASPEELRGGSAGPARPYWSYRDVVVAGLADPIRDEQEALQRLEGALSEAIRDQSMADVPVGAFLSGGIDSSTVAALYSQHNKVRTFTIGFEDAAFDEADHARAVARHLGTDHHEMKVTAREAQEVIPLLPAIYDEPFADSSQLPTYLVSRFAREQVKVALTGDGGDEMFGGYNRHLAAPRLWAHARKFPRPLRAAAGGALGRVPASAWNGAADLLGRRSRQPHFGSKVQKALRTMGSASGIDDVYESFVDEWYGENSPVLEGDGLSAEQRLDGEAPDAVRMMYRDAVSYLPGDILTKVDRAAMAVSLETRVPLIDHRVAELAARIPLEMKIVRGSGKQVLRNILFQHVPQAVFDRPKTGFAVPVGDWLKGPLRPWAEELLNERRLRNEGFFNVAQVRQRWNDHVSGGRESTAALWSILMFQAWAAEAGRC